MAAPSVYPLWRKPVNKCGQIGIAGVTGKDTVSKLEVYSRSLGTHPGNTWDFMQSNRHLTVKVAKLGGADLQCLGKSPLVQPKVASSPEMLGTSKFVESFIGCKRDCLGGRDLPVAKGKCTAVVCASRCFGYKYYGLQKSDTPGYGTCSCGMLVGTQGDADGCQCEAARADASKLLKCKNCEKTSVGMTD